MSINTTDVTLYLTHKGTEYECTLSAQGYVCTSGSNSHGSDEPESVEVEDVVLHNARGNRVSKRLLALITSSDWDYIATCLIEN